MFCFPPLQEELVIKDDQQSIRVYSTICRITILAFQSRKL